MHLRNSGNRISLIYPESFDEANNVKAVVVKQGNVDIAKCVLRYFSSFEKFLHRNTRSNYEMKCVTKDHVLTPFIYKLQYTCMMTFQNKQFVICSS